MDYQGNYFPEEKDENESKVYRIIKGIFKWTMYSLSFIVYAILFTVLFINRDSKILEKNYMASLPVMENVDTDSLELFRINTKVFMNEDGSMQLHNVDYSDEYGVMEIGVKFNAKKLTDNDRGDCLNYVLSDAKGNTYNLEKIVTDSGGRYGFARICFTGLDIDLDSNDLRYDAEHPTELRSNEVYTLTVTRKSDGKNIYVFTIYDNSVTFTRTDYEE